MKFAEHLSAHITPEWRKQYISYEEMKSMLYNAMERQPSCEVTDKEDLVRYNRAFDEDFFGFCEKELAKINTFFAEKLAEATRKFSNLRNELHVIREKQQSVQQQQLAANAGSRRPSSIPTVAGDLATRQQNESVAITVGSDAVSSGRSAAIDSESRLKQLLERKAMFRAEERKHTRKMHELKLGFSEFYLSLVLLQNYQNLNFTGFRKILKKHDKLVDNDSGAKWREHHVERAPFYLNKDIGQLIEQTESVFINDLESGDRQKAMKRLRVPPLNDQQNPWTTFKVGFFSGCFVILIVIVIVSGMMRLSVEDLRIVFRLYRAPFLLILFLFLIAFNVYGWRTSGVNHVLIFELDPRDHLSEQHLIEIASIFSVFWSLSMISYLYSYELGIPAFTNPLSLLVLMFVFLFNPTPTLMHSARFWLLKVLYRIFCAPLFRVTFADFWLADQLNSLVPVFVDTQYIACFYLSNNPISNDNWQKTHDVEKCISNNRSDLIIRTVMACLPAWFRFAQCVRRYRDDQRGPFPHLVNAGKYSTTFFVVVFSSLSKYYDAEYNSSFENPFFYCWIICMVASSCYTYVWDIKMDWGLFSRDSPKETPFLREEIVYSSPFYYYFAIVEDLILRFAWTVSVSLIEVGVIHSDLMLSILAPLEIFRRFVWNYFRLENEHLNNCGEFRAVRDISITPVDTGDQAKIIKMMDDVDGVINRKLSIRKASKEFRAKRLLSNKRLKNNDVQILIGNVGSTEDMQNYP